MADLTSSSSDERFSAFVAHLVGRLSTLKARLKGEDMEKIQIIPPPFSFLRIAGHQTDIDLQEKVGALYVDSVFWLADPSELNQELVLLQGQLKQLLRLKGRDPRWLIAWGAAQKSIPPVTLSDYWGGRSVSAREPSIPGLFSAQGKSLIDAFFQEIDGALNDPAIAGELKTSFDRWYRENAFESWRQFVAVFPRGREMLTSADSWRQMAPQMGGDKSPYFVLIKNVNREFESTAAIDLVPWVRHLRQLRDLQATPDFWRYRQALEKAAKAVSDPSQASQSTAQAFDSAVAPGSSAFGAAFDALAKLKSSAPRDVSQDPIVWNLVSGPLQFLWEHARQETADRLQSDWESKVLANATGLDGTQALPVLLTQDGPVMRFAKDQAAPYVEWKPGNGYCAKEMFGGSVPFTSAFFSFLNGAVWVSSIKDLQVDLTALAPETNANAKRIPHITRLTLHCGGKTQVLSNRRLRVIEKSFNEVEKSFVWSSACDATDLEIDIAGTRLVKTYPGAFGFFAFLHDFKDGKHTFYRSNFPEKAKDLADLGVESIAMHYRLRGAPDFAAPKAAPAKIVWSWSR